MPIEQPSIPGDTIIVPRVQDAPSESGSVISDIENKNRKKTVVFVILILLLLTFLGITVSVFQKKQPIADIRNYAFENETAPKRGFGSIAAPTAPPAQVAADNDQSCPGGSCSVNSSKTVSAVATRTPTPTIIRKVTKKPTMHITQSPTPIPVLSCQRIEILRGSENMTEHISNIQHNDAIQFIGYVGDVGRTVSTITFRLTINDRVAEEKEVAAVLSNGFWVGQYAYTFSTYGKHRITIAAITPK